MIELLNSADEVPCSYQCPTEFVRQRRVDLFAVREINGSTLAEAKVLFDKLTVAGTAIAAPRYAGTMIRLPTGGTIGLRTIAGRSPRTLATIDIDIPGCPIRKVKFNPVINP